MVCVAHFATAAGVACSDSVLHHIQLGDGGGCRGGTSLVHGFVDAAQTMIFWHHVQVHNVVLVRNPIGLRCHRQQQKEHLGHIKHCTLQLFLITLTADDKLGIEDCHH